MLATIQSTMFIFRLLLLYEFDINLYYKTFVEQIVLSKWFLINLLECIMFEI
jgi:hypothetical protein